MEFATYIIKAAFLSPCRYFVMNIYFGILTFRGKGYKIVCFFEMHEFQITRKQLQVILARSSIIQAQSVVFFFFVSATELRCF